MININILLGIINFALQWRMYNWSKKQLEKHQKRRIGKVIHSARKKSEYYRNIIPHSYKTNLQNIPIMNKKIMMDNYNEIITKNLDRDKLVDFAIEHERKGEWELYRNRYTIGLSSGTSGNKVLSVLSRKELWLYHFTLFSRSGIPKSVKQKRVLFSLRTNSPLFMEFKSLGIYMFFMDYTYSVDEIIDVINSKKLNIIAGPPSLLELISEKKEKIQHKIDVIISFAEVLNDLTREKISQKFNIPIVQIYQGTEGFIASTCKCGNLHLNEDLLYFEFIPVEDNIGNARNMLITDLYRKLQPMIRYQINDIVELSNERCKCGSSFQMINKIHGRADDVFLLLDNQGETKYLFPDYVRRSINQSSLDIIEYQAIQKKRDLIEIRLILKEGANREEIQNQILKNLHFWVDKIGANVGKVEFTSTKPEKHPVSMKLIRVIRRLEDENS